MNLEALCARAAQGIVDGVTDKEKRKKMQTTTRNSLGVLREDGTFAFYLYCKYRASEGGEVIWSQVARLWARPEIGPLLPAGRDPRQQVITLTDNLSDLLLARRLAEQTLIYALYGLRAGEGGG